MKRKISITVKFIFLLSLLMILVTSGLLVNLVVDTGDFLEKSVTKQVDSYGELFNSYFGDTNRFKNYTFVNSTINSLVNRKDYVESLDIIWIKKNTDPKELFIYASSEEGKKGLSPDYKKLHIDALESFDLEYNNIRDTYTYVIVEPIFSEELGDYRGTYEMVLNLKEDFKIFETYQSNTINTAIFAFILMIFIAIFIVYILIQKPLSKLKSATISLGKGNLDARADVKSRDEFGDLAETFNNMAEDLKKSRKKIEDYNRILEKLLEQKDEFIGQLGHDLKNPMQPLVGLLPILIEKEKDPENKEMLEVMHANVEYMQDLIFDTLKLAKLRSDNIEFNYEKLNLRELSDKVVKTQKTMLEEKNIKIVNKIKDDISVYADKLRLSEVFKNLINNSVKYTDESGGKITLDADIQDKDTVKVSVSDKGIGMTKDQISKVFDEFYKADKQTSDYYSTGLGLAICKRIVEKHNGKIWVDSKGPGKGSTFYFTLKKKKF